MKCAKYLAAITVFSIAMSVSLLADTAAKESGKITIPDTVQVGSTRLAPGDYKVEWTGTGDNVQISILSGKKVKATAEGKIVQLPEPANSNAIVTRSAGNNMRALDQIQFNNRKEALQLARSQMPQN